MKHLLLALLLVTANCFAQLALQTSVEFPPKYQPADVQALLGSIDYPLLARQADAAFPGLLAANVRFMYQPIVFHSAIGRPDRQGVLVLVEAQPGWGREAELKSYLAKYLEQRIAGAK